MGTSLSINKDLKVVKYTYDDFRQNLKDDKNTSFELIRNWRDADSNATKDDPLNKEDLGSKRLFQYVDWESNEDHEHWDAFIDHVESYMQGQKLHLSLIHI